MIKYDDNGNDKSYICDQLYLAPRYTWAWFIGWVDWAYILPISMLDIDVQKNKGRKRLIYSGCWIGRRVLMLWIYFVSIWVCGVDMFGGKEKAPKKLCNFFPLENLVCQKDKLFQLFWTLSLGGGPWYIWWKYICSQLVCLSPPLLDYQRDICHFLHHHFHQNQWSS